MSFLISILLFAAWAGLCATLLTTAYDVVGRFIVLPRNGVFIPALLQLFAAVHASPFSLRHCPPLGTAIAVALLAVVAQYVPTLLLQWGANVAHPASKEMRPFKKVATVVLLAALAGQLAAFLLRLYLV